MPRKRKAGKSPKSSRRAGGRGVTGPSLSGGFKQTTSSVAGQEDVEYTTHRYEYSVLQVCTAGAVAMTQLKSNSIYRPYVGNTDSVGGYARMYTQYLRSLVVGARVRVTITGSATTIPMRVAIVPCSATQYTVYSAYTSAAQLRDVPHSSERISGASKAVVCTSSSRASEVLFGERKEDRSVESSTASYYGTTGADPGNVTYFLVALQPLDAITSSAYVNVQLSFKVKWFQPIATAVQVSVNRWGNEEALEESKGREAKSESKGPLRTSAKGQAHAAGETKSRQDKQQERSTCIDNVRAYGGDGLLFGEEAGPESDDPEEVWLRKKLAAALGTVPTRAAFKAALKASVSDPPQS